MVEVKKKDTEQVMNHRIEEIEDHYQKRETHLLGQIENLEKKIETFSNHSPKEHNIVSKFEGNSVSSNPVSFRQGFDIEEVVKAHPEVHTKKFKTTIKKQERYIEYLENLLFEAVDESTFIISTN